jgi:hypothetical protein
MIGMYAAAAALFARVVSLVMKVVTGRMRRYIRV